MIRLYFDECVSRRFPVELKEFYAVDCPELETAHMLDDYEAGEFDSVWLERLTSDKTWIVVTQDLGKDPKKEKLPTICKHLGITHLAFSPAIINAGYTIQKTAIVTAWQQILLLPKAPPGTHVRLSVLHGKKAVPRYELSVKGKPFSVFIAPFIEGLP